MACGAALACLTAASEPPGPEEALSKASHEILTHKLSRASASGAATAAASQVPSLIGYTCEEARARLQRLDAELVCKVGIFRGTVLAGRINEQSPEPGTPFAQRLVHATTEPPPSVPEVRFVTVPDVVNKTVPQAMADLEKTRLIGAPEPPADDPFHVVSSQEPVAGARVAVHSRVFLRAAFRVDVPDLRRITCARAVFLAHERGFDEVQCLERSEGPPALEGLVIAQEPNPGIVLDKPRLLKAYVLRAGHTAPGTSDGPVPGTPAEVVRVPAVTGKMLVDAVEIVHAAQLAVESEGPSQAPELRVVAQRPPPDQMVPRGSLVRLAVRIEVPDFGNVSCGDAQALGRKRGLPAVRCQWGAAPDERHATGRVFAQSVPAGELLDASELVVVTMAGIVVPDVEGRNVAEARHALDVLRLNAVPDLADGARVVDHQAPDPGVMANVGDAVRLTTRALVAPPDRTSARWVVIGAAALLVAGGVVGLRLWRSRLPLRFRGEPDRAPIVLVRLESPSGPRLPSIIVRGERGTAHVVIRWLDGSKERSSR
jgi:beta-lactam-binding protein with PASTA domain